MVGLLLLSGEIILRNASVQQWLALPSVGSSDPYFELHVANLDRFAAENDSIDCVFIGSSLVVAGIDAASISAGMREDFVCYSFAVPGLTFETGKTLVEFLVNRYDPQIIIYGFSPLAFKTRPYDTVQTQVRANALVQYEVGEASLQGFLLEYSTLYRYYLRYGAWSQYDFASSLDDLEVLENELTAFGFQERTGSPLDVTQEISPDFVGLPLDSANTTAFEELLNLVEQNNLRIAFLQMPLHTRIIEANTQDYQQHEAFLAQTILDTEILFWQPQVVFSDDYWSDYVHLNAAGASLMSAWVLAQLEAIFD